MNYIQERDYSVVIRGQYLNQIQTNSGVMDYAERLAIEEVKSHLVGRYKIDEMLRPVFQYNSTVAYTFNSRVASTSGDIYIASSTAGTAGIPLTNNSFFVKNDDRPILLTTYIVDIWLYHMFASINPNSVEDNRSRRYKEALEKIKEFATGKTTLIGSIPKDNNEGSVFLWAGNIGQGYNMFNGEVSNRKDVFKNPPNPYYTNDF